MELLIGLIITVGIYWLAMAEHRRLEKQKHERLIAKELAMKLHGGGLISSAEAIELLGQFEDTSPPAAEAGKRWDEKKERMRKKAEERSNQASGDRL